MEPQQRVRIPRSAKRRGEQCWAKLLRRINPRLSSVMAFEGKLVKCGQEVCEEELWPAPDYPMIPVLLEHAGISEAGWGHRRSSHAYVLWRFEKGLWVELARASSVGDEWVSALRPAARRALEEQETAPALDSSAAADMLVGLLDEHLAGRDGRKRKELLTLIYHAVSFRLAEEEYYASANASVYTGRRGPETESGSRTGEDARCQVVA